MKARKITIVVSGETDEGMDCALIAACRPLQEGYLSGHNRFDSCAYYFDVTTDVPDGELPA